MGADKLQEAREYTRLWVTTALKPITDAETALAFLEVVMGMWTTYLKSFASFEYVEALSRAYGIPVDDVSDAVVGWQERWAELTSLLKKDGRTP